MREVKLGMATGSPGGYGGYMVAASSSLFNMAGQAASAAGNVAGQVQNMGASVRDGVASVCQVIFCLFLLLSFLSFLLFPHLYISQSQHCQQLGWVGLEKLSELAVCSLCCISAVQCSLPLKRQSMDDTAVYCGNAMPWDCHGHITVLKMK